MLKYIILVTNFQKLPSAESFLLLTRNFTLDFNDINLRDLVKLLIFNLIMTKSNFKKLVMKSFQWSHRYYAPNYKRQNIFQIFSPPLNQNFWLIQCDHANQQRQKNLNP